MTDTSFAQKYYKREIKHRDNVNGVEGIIIGYLTDSNKKPLIKMIEYAGIKGLDYAFIKRNWWRGGYKIIDEDKLDLKNIDIIYEMRIEDIELIEYNKNEISKLIEQLEL